MIKPLFDNVLLKKVEEEKATTSGIVLASKEETSNIAVVVAFSSSTFFNNTLSNNGEGELTAGSKVVFSDNYKKVNFKNEEYILVNEEEVLAVIED